MFVIKLLSWICIRAGSLIWQVMAIMVVGWVVWLGVGGGKDL